MGGTLSTTSDLSINTRLFVHNDVSLNGNVTIAGRLYIGANSIYANSIMGGTLSTTSDLSLSTRLFVNNDVSFNGNLYVKYDTSLNGNLYVKGNVVFDGSVNYTANSISTDSIQLGVNNYFGMFQYQYSGKTLYDLDADKFLITRYVVVDSETHNVLYSNTELTIKGNITSLQDMNVSGNLYVGNNISITGRSSATSFETESDYRIKANVKSLLDTSFTVELLKPVTYINKKINRQDIGFIAHEVQEQIPFLVTGEKDCSGLQTLNYIGFIGILTKEVQELKKENITLRYKIQKIEEYLSKNHSYN
jgi:cytoskeletal protein CcmA (bactofilin family)